MSYVQHETTFEQRPFPEAIQMNRMMPRNFCCPFMNKVLYHKYATVDAVVLLVYKFLKLPASCVMWHSKIIVTGAFRSIAIIMRNQSLY